MEATCDDSESVGLLFLDQAVNTDPSGSTKALDVNKWARCEHGTRTCGRLKAEKP